MFFFRILAVAYLRNTLAACHFGVHFCYYFFPGCLKRGSMVQNQSFFIILFTEGTETIIDIFLLEFRPGHILLRRPPFS